MQPSFKAIIVVVVVLFFSVFSSITITQAQTPASVPGPTPGVNSSTGGDGSPEVPFDGRMSLVFAAFGIVYLTKKLNKKALIA